VGSLPCCMLTDRVWGDGGTPHFPGLQDMHRAAADQGRSHAPPVLRGHASHPGEPEGAAQSHETRFSAMASPDQLKALIQSHLRRDDGQFLSVAMQVAAQEAKAGRGKLALELRELIDAAKARLEPTGAGKLVPIAAGLQSATRRGELDSLLSVSHPAARLADMVLDDATGQQLARVVREQRQFSRLQAHGLQPRRKLLLVGPPGTGKTMTAAALAGELGVPLMRVRLDALITKFMGETAAKLRLVFDTMADVRGVYFFDEFDAIGSQRALGQDVGEIRRVLNSFLQMIEQDSSHSLIVAATNHVEALDQALFRRFDDVLSYPLPSQAQAVALLRSRLGAFCPKPWRAGAWAKPVQDLSHADICRAVDEAIKHAVLNDSTLVQGPDLLQALGERRAMGERLSLRPGQARPA
jgi:SpoVK/Ycf46/Vps4 family AAA+-type ATPase